MPYQHFEKRVGGSTETKVRELDRDGRCWTRRPAEGDPSVEEENETKER
jgi:hypothetical protein